MSRTGIADKDRLLLRIVTSLTICLAGVDGMSVVETSAHRVPFDQLITHDVKADKKMTSGASKFSEREYDIA